jgi:hypothetical protein
MPEQVQGIAANVEQCSLSVIERMSGVLRFLEIRSFICLETIMNTRNVARVILGVCVMVVASGANAQTTGDNASQSAAARATPAPTSTPSVAGAGQTPNGTTHKQHKHQKHHTVSHNRSHGHGATMAVASAASDRETTYRATLRRCVEGPNARRDSCLDDAIARFGHP